MNEPKPGDEPIISPVRLREHLEALLEAGNKAVQVASEEREKAAAALREQLTERIASGDLNLREHITSQIAQLKAMVDSAERLELSRYDTLDSKLDQLNQAGHAAVEARIAGVQREVALVQDSAKEAITKAEAAAEKRFEGVNEFRSQLSDQAARFVTREVLEATVDKFAIADDRCRKDIDGLSRRMDIREGQSAGQRLTMGSLVTTITVAVAVIGTLVVLANVLSSP